MSSALIQPTGDEIRSGVVEDTDGPMIRAVLEGLAFSVSAAVPAADCEDEIAAAIEGAARRGFALMVLIGGSGGGRRCDPALNRDLTHTAMDRLLTDLQATALYGKNGHLWSRLVCGRLNGTLVVNVPGPFREARAAIEAFAACYRGPDTDLKELNRSMAQAVCATYG